MIGRRLNGTEIVSYRHLPARLADRVRIVEIPALPGKYKGLTLGPVVLLATDVSDRGDSALMAHELTHVRQWHEWGVARFAWRYVWSFARHFVRSRSWSESYRAIPAEVEAREEATRWARSHNRFT